MFGFLRQRRKAPDYIFHGYGRILAKLYLGLSMMMFHTTHYQSGYMRYQIDGFENFDRCSQKEGVRFCDDLAYVTARNLCVLCLIKTIVVATQKKYTGLNIFNPFSTSYKLYLSISLLD